MTDNNHIAVFDQARVLYRKYGTVRGNATEFADFKRKHRDWKAVLPLIRKAIDDQAFWRAVAIGFVPPWKNFKTWIYQRCWEEEHPARTRGQGESPEKMAERKKEKMRSEYTPWIIEATQDALDDFVKRCPHVKWLVDEIQAQSRRMK